MHAVKISLPPPQVVAPTSWYHFGVGLSLFVPQFCHLCNGMVTPSHQGACSRCVSSHPTPEYSTAKSSPQMMSLCPGPRTPQGSHIPSLPLQGEQLAQRARVRISLGIMVPVGPAFGAGVGNTLREAGYSDPLGETSPLRETTSPSRGLAHWLVCGATQLSRDGRGAPSPRRGCGRF